MSIFQRRRITFLCALAASVVVPGRVAAQRATGITAASPAVATSPRATFSPLMADEREIRTFFKVASGGSPFEDTRIFSAAVGDGWRLIRFGEGPEVGLLQVELTGAVFAQFDLDEPSFDLLNADFVVGFPISYRRGRFSGRLRPYHQSSHLGDDYLSRTPPAERRTFDFESVELLASLDATEGLRLYGGGEHRFRRSPETLEPLVVHLGAEGRQRSTLGTVSGLGEARLLGAVHMTSQESAGWSPAWSVRGGIELTSHPSKPGRHRFAVMVEFFDGPSPYGHFYRDSVRFFAIGLHLTR